MSFISRSTAALTFHGPDLVPYELTSKLGSPPTRSHQKGEKKCNSDLTWSTGYWSFDAAERTPGDLGGQIEELFNDLTDDMNAWQDLTSRSEARVFVGLFLNEQNEMIDLSPATLKLLAERNIRIAFDIYAGSNEEAH